MSEFITDFSKNIIDIFIPVTIIIAPVVVSSFFFDILDNLFNVLGNYSLLPHDFYSNVSSYDDSVLYIKNNYKKYFDMKSTQFIISFEINEYNKILFENLKTIILKHKDNNYDFFIGQMKGNIKNEYVNLLNSINDTTDLKTFLNKNYSVEFIYIFLKKVYLL